MTAWIRNLMFRLYYTGVLYVQLFCSICIINVINQYRSIWLGVQETCMQEFFITPLLYIYNHKSSFKFKRHSNKKTLLSYMRRLKSALRCIPQYSNVSKKYLLCFYEKLKIPTYQNQKELLNKRSELLCKCRHASKFPLKNYTRNDFR